MAVFLHNCQRLTILCISRRRKNWIANRSKLINHIETEWDFKLIQNDLS